MEEPLCYRRKKIGRKEKKNLNTAFTEEGYRAHRKEQVEGSNRERVPERVEKRPEKRNSKTKFEIRKKGQLLSVALLNYSTLALLGGQKRRYG
jgi:hypothetical protein